MPKNPDVNFLPLHRIRLMSMPRTNDDVNPEGMTLFPPTPTTANHGRGRSGLPIPRHVGGSRGNDRMSPDAPDPNASTYLAGRGLGVVALDRLPPVDVGLGRLFLPVAVDLEGVIVGSSN